ncbi:hypothetical protein GCM10027614_04360 [Micromonospora vulcania]
MGTAYHNQATALLHRSITRPAPDESVREAAQAASRACELRQALLDPMSPLSVWEMANTYGVYARCLVLIGELDRADAVLAMGNRLVEWLGPAGAQPALHLGMAQDAVAHARATAEGTGAPRRRWWHR